MPQLLVVYSGGMDSFTLLHQSIIHANAGDTFYDSVAAVSFDYGQRHKKELEVASRVTKKLGIPHSIVSLETIKPFISTSALTGDVTVPEGHYTADNMKLTVVPGRNTIMLSVAMGIAQNYGMAGVAYGAHSGDHTIYPDCRPEYLHAMQAVYRRATEDKVKLIAPLMYIDKGRILEIGLAFGLDYADTWTCYVGGNHPCGKCGACVERAEAFESNGVSDPLLAPGSPAEPV